MWRFANKILHKPNIFIKAVVLSFMSHLVIYASNLCILFVDEPPPSSSTMFSAFTWRNMQYCFFVRQTVFKKTLGIPLSFWASIRRCIVLEGLSVFCANQRYTIHKIFVECVFFYISHLFFFLTSSAVSF